jgi:hypothetical protein
LRRAGGAEPLERKRETGYRRAGLETYKKKRKIELTLSRKSPRAPLFQRGECSSLLEREDRRDYLKNVVTIMERDHVTRHHDDFGKG